jgi:flagellar M-ring protein FliF
MTLDFTQTEITTEDFDSQDKGPKTRSELFVEDRNTLRDAVGLPGSLANTPPAQNNPQATTQSNSDPLKGVSEKGVQVTARSTKNYELDRSVRHTKGAMGTITKIGVGVLINERPIPAGTKLEKPADGSAPPTSVPYTPEELDRLNQLVKGAVGFNETRGDVVTVVATKFEPQFDPSIIPWYRDENYQVMVNAGVVGAIFLLVLLLVVRPMVRRLTAPKFYPGAVAAAAAEAANAEAKMAIEVATAEAAAAKLSAKQAREAHEAEIARIAEEAVLAAQEAARLSEEAQIAAAAKAEADALAALNPEAGELSEEIEIQEGESLDEVKARMAAMKPKKQSISADLLNTANSYDDKVALIRMIVAEDSTRVAGVLKSLIRQ